MGTETRHYEDLLMDIDNQQDLKEQILDKLMDHRNQWKEKINDIMQSKKYSNSKMARLCGVSHTMVASWKKGALPRTRDTFIKIGFAAGYQIDEMNHFLKKYGQYPGLYPKIPQDCVYIYVLNNKDMDHTYEECEELMEDLQEVMLKNLSGSNMESGERRMTRDAWGELMKQETVEDLKKFMEQQNGQFEGDFELFYDLIQNAVAQNNRAANLLYGESTEEGSVHYLAMMQEMSSSLVHTIYEIFQKKWFPRREKVIELGIYLNQTKEQIDGLLEAAHLQKLYVKNPMECALIYGIVDAELCGQIRQGTNDMYVHVAKVLEEIDYEVSI